jgi:hypothetical protein
MLLKRAHDVLRVHDQVSHVHFIMVVMPQTKALIITCLKRYLMKCSDSMIRSAIMHHGRGAKMGAHGVFRVHDYVSYAHRCYSLKYKRVCKTDYFLCPAVNFLLEK